METFFAELFARDIQVLKNELNSFKDEANIWKTLPGVTNPAGNLALHLIGNLNHFIGATLGNTGYIRQRDLEFSTKGTARDVLTADIDKTADMVSKVLSGLTTEMLAAPFPFEMFGKRDTAFYLMHFYGHLTYHNGQINYLRRMLEA